MKILHVANFSYSKYGAAYYSIDRKLSNGLIRNSHFVYDFSYRDVARSEGLFGSKKLGRTKMNQRLSDAVANICPDLLLLGHSELVEPDTLKYIKKKHKNIKIALWYVDPLFHATHLQHIFDRLEHIDALFFTTAGQWLEPFKQPNNRVCFFPNPVDESIETLHNNEKSSFDNDLIFCGRDKGEAERVNFLGQLVTSLKGLKIEIRGSLGKPLVFGDDYIKLLATSKMGLNLSRRNDVYLYSSDRIAQLTGNGLLTFTPDTPGMLELYSDREVIYFSKLGDLVEKIQYFSKHDSERREIATAGRTRSHCSYNSTRVAKYILEVCFDLPLSEPYDWHIGS